MGMLINNATYLIRLLRELYDLMQEQCKEIFALIGLRSNLKIRYQGNISCKNGHNKGQKWYGQNKSRIDEEEVGRIHRWTIQKSLNVLDNHDGVIIHLEPNILDCEVKWASGNIIMNNASGDDGIPAELFQILKDDIVKVLQSICQQIWNCTCHMRGHYLLL